MTDDAFDEEPQRLPLFATAAGPIGHDRPGRVRSTFRLNDPEASTPRPARVEPGRVGVPASLVPADEVPVSLLPRLGSGGLDWGRV